MLRSRSLSIDSLLDKFHRQPNRAAAQQVLRLARPPLHGHMTAVQLAGRERLDTAISGLGSTDLDKHEPKSTYLVAQAVHPSS